MGLIYDTSKLGVLIVANEATIGPFHFSVDVPVDKVVAVFESSENSLSVLR